MPSFVIDASAPLPWCFEDEATPWTESLLDRIAAGDTLVVPAHWPVEVSNALLMGERRKRLQPGRAHAFWLRLVAFPISVEAPLTPHQCTLVLALCNRHRLTVYDAAYLEIAVRRGLPLATLDTELIQASRVEGVPLLT